MTAELPIAVIRRHQQFAEIFRARKTELGLTNDFIDHVGGLVSGHADKLLGPSETRHWGALTFDLFCELFALEFHVYIDSAAAERMKDIWEGRHRVLGIEANSRISRKLIEKAKPFVIQEMGRAGGKASWAKRSGPLAAEEMRKLGRKSGRKRRRNMRERLRERAAEQGAKDA